MATWEDGPEYAPLQRPDAFAEPSASTVGLEAPPPPPSNPPAPPERPVFGDPPQAVPALDTLVPAPPEARDPEQPFDVVSSVMTSESSAWASAHWTRQQPAAEAPPPPAGPAQQQVYGQQAYGRLAETPSPNGSTTPNGSTGTPSQPNGRHPSGDGSAFPPPTGYPAFPPPTTGPTPYPPSQHQPGPYQPAPYQPSPYQPSQAFPPPSPPPGPGQFPAPGTPQWFAPGSYQPAPPPPAAPNARAVLAAATPGVLVTLVVGAFIWVLAPVTLIVAFVLTSRMTHGRKPTRTAFAAVLAFLGLVGLLSLVTADGIFSDWWDSVAGWACFGSWVMLVAIVIAVYRAVKQGRADPPPTPRVSLR